nr:MAG TPA_asm: hypothetical protein [Bacteriophage sp.]DAP05578.1 MAG TPA: hypothetical protein [Caudoviricetes sp.]
MASHSCSYEIVISLIEKDFKMIQYTAIYLPVP